MAKLSSRAANKMADEMVERRMQRTLFGDEVAATKKVVAKKTPAKKVVAKKAPAKRSNKITLAPAPTKTREEWLNTMATALRPVFAEVGTPIPEKVRVSCGWPHTRSLASGKGVRRVGECWDAKLSKDNTFEIFISPVLMDTKEVAGTLTHELVHAAVGLQAGHGPEFKKLALAVGLEGKMTSTTIGQGLGAWIDDQITRLGKYPHATLDTTKRKKQTTRLVKVICPNMECEHLQENERPYVARLSMSALDYGAPKCGCCNDLMVIDEKPQVKKRKAA